MTSLRITPRHDYETELYLGPTLLQQTRECTNTVTRPIDLLDGICSSSICNEGYWKCLVTIRWRTFIKASFDAVIKVHIMCT